ncbi:FecR domain-containing protein [Agriterribacter sp.]|uniref:FecR family protein n=1 Tax=Agriterribacter sp. TaxID=2821509 RepID=UPI002C7AB3BE|nr:FecR domain-containing protein [Agriterribacter sp.]HRP54448.1 FecR domain-containing protein [Agriterribacter sp.]
MSANKFQELIDKYLTNAILAEEQEQLFDMIEKKEYRADLEKVVKEALDISFEVEEDEALRERIFGLLQQRKNRSTVFRIYSLRRWGWSAASVVLILASVLVFRTINKKSNAPAPAIATVVDVEPGRDGAILTLADGTHLLLDSLDNGVVATQNGVQAVLKNGQLAYEVKERIAGEVVYNTMTTPKGRQYHMTLPDGTRVWLNAASSVYFPTVFSNKKRDITITGEVYLEVAPDPRRPFTVTAGKTTIEVLGTHFNVMAYENEAVMKTTLAEGSVQLSHGEHKLTLLPGQQAQVTGDITRLVKDVDMDAELAWKNGWFNFKYMDIQTVMKQVERWYDITVEYEGRIPEKRFNGELPRNVKLSELLEILRFSEVKFALQGKVLTIKE